MPTDADPTHHPTTPPLPAGRPAGGLRLVVALAGVAAVLGVASLAAKVGRDALNGSIVGFFDVTAERNLPAWYNTSLLVLAGVVAGAAAMAARRSERGRATVLGWWGVTVLLLVMSVDELTSLHERLGRAAKPVVTDAVRSLVGDRLDGILGTAWIVPGIVIVVLLAVTALWWWRSAPHQVRTWFAVGFAVLVTGALGFETVSALTSDYPIAFTLAGHVEEFLEMIGAAVMLAAVLRAFVVAPAPDDPSAITIRYAS